MRGIIRNTTAVAACLSMLAPQFVLAQGPLPAAGIVAPAGGPKQAETGSRILAQARNQNDPQVIEEERRKARRAAETKGDQNGGDRQQGHRPAQKAKPPVRQGQPAPKQAQPVRQAQPQGRKDGALQANSAEPGQQANTKRPQQPAQKPQAQGQQRQEPRPHDAAPPRQQRQVQKAHVPTPAAVQRASSETARLRAGNMGGLSRILDREIAAGLPQERLACISGGVYPCPPGGRLVTPRGVVLERNANGRYLLAPAGAQLYRVNGEGQMVARNAGNGGQNGGAARDAARETRAANAAALDQARQNRNVVRQQITEANRRSSAQDFQGDLRDALTRRQDQPRADRKSDDDDKRDLAKALLLGLGAVAVGSMLNNNRQVALSSPDRVVVTRPDGGQEVVKDEVALLRQPGSTITTEDFDDGSSRTVVTRPDGSKVVTIRDADLRVLRRTLIAADGRTTRLIDDTEAVPPVDIAELPAPAPVRDLDGTMDEAALRAALQRQPDIDRHFTLGQIRNIPEVRALVPPVDIDAITFDSGSAAISPHQARQLSALGSVITEAVTGNPREIFLIEGHTDTVGPDAMNLALSDRRAESVALALTEYFDVPPENLIVQGYGEEYPKIRAEGDIRENRRASVRRITELLQTAEAQ
ncbi:OmpA family protein [Paracoccus marinaquae]|uniref:OmpA family protein n=1 Tax=Paracoccus marinaquae TaxID=2841926 RepID=A0ABS6AFZ4_9RHOB|nr:OmpA family protein [Paracoccus marinaquae]MBU3028600.1 OmpA family protein [Paracoccus marinaquae]